MHEEADGAQAGLPAFSDDLLDGRALMGHEDYAMWSMSNRGYEATQGHPPRNVPSTEDDDDVMNEYVLKRFRDTAEHDFLVGTQARTGGRFKGMSLMRVDEVGPSQSPPPQGVGLV